MDLEELREYCQLAGLQWDEEDEEWWYCLDGSRDRFPEHLPYDDWPEWRSMTEDNPALFCYVAELLTSKVRGLDLLGEYVEALCKQCPNAALIFATAEQRCHATAAVLKETNNES